jgi:predicted ribosomally synthesized peptide with nif11-like leader
MSVQSALEFVRRVRRDPAIQQEIARLGGDGSASRADIAWLVEIAATAGFVFTGEDLQKAHKHDWGMRWARLSHRSGLPEDSGQ